MKVSVITVCRNSGTTLEAAMLSVIEQDHTDIEYIVIDGRSTDGTSRILEKYRSKISKLVSEKDEGMYFALNKGISMATGNIIGILHSDDFYSGPKVISRVAKQFESEKCDSVYGDLQYVSKDDAHKVIRHWKSEPFEPKLFLRGWMPPHPTFFAKRECYEKLGAFNTAFSISADYELMLRFLYKHGISSSYIPEVMVKMRTGGISNAGISSRVKANQEDRRAWKINGLKPTSFTLILKPLSKLRQFI